MGGVLSAVAVVFFAVVDPVITSLSRKPKRPPSIQQVVEATGKSNEDLIREAQAAIPGLDPVNCFNFAIVGPTGKGKSTIINVLRLMQDPPHGTVPPLGGTNSAAVGITQTTDVISRYDFPDDAGLSHVKIWDVPGSGTTEHPAEGYYMDKKLYAFDAVLIVTAGTLLAIESSILRGSILFKREAAIVFAKMDQAFDDIRDNSANDVPDTEVVRIVREIKEGEFRAKIADKFPGFSIPRYLFSSRWFRRGILRFDEQALLEYIRAAAVPRQ